MPAPWRRRRSSHGDVHFAGEAQGGRRPSRSTTIWKWLGLRVVHCGTDLYSRISGSPPGARPEPRRPAGSTYHSVTGPTDASETRRSVPPAARGHTAAMAASPSPRRPLQAQGHGQGKPKPKLDRYRAKRDFRRTPEPSGGGRKAAGRDGGRFVVQEHDATRLHWDLRLERDGVLVSWAIPNGIPMSPKENRKAVHVEDHPLDYIDFEGVIPEGYGAGTVKLWDTGTYELEKWQPKKVIVTFHGNRLNGKYALFQAGSPKDWMIHRMDPPADPEREPMPAHLVPMLAKLGIAARAGRRLRLRDQVGRHQGARLLRARPVPHREPQPQRHHRAVPGAAPARPPARLARRDPRRRDRRLRRAGPAELRAPPAPHAPDPRSGHQAAREGDPGALRAVRRALPRGALGDGPPI